MSRLVIIHGRTPLWKRACARLGHLRKFKLLLASIDGDQTISLCGLCCDPVPPVFSVAREIQAGKTYVYQYLDDIAEPEGGSNA